MSTGIVALRTFFVVAITAVTCLVSGIHSRNDVIEVDLQNGIIKGWSSAVTWLVRPTYQDEGSEEDEEGRTQPRPCDKQAVIRVDFGATSVSESDSKSSAEHSGNTPGGDGGTEERSVASARFHLSFYRPRLWTLDISDSPGGDGYGDDNGTTSNMAELQVLNRQMRIYSNRLPGYLDATIDGGLLMRVEDDAVSARKYSSLTIDVSDERVAWTQGDHGRRQFIESKYLYTLAGQDTLYGSVEQAIYVGFNRVVADHYRNGSGLCAVNITIGYGKGGDCQEDGTGCHRDAVCAKTKRTTRCRCKQGFYGNGKICIDENECEYDNGGCSHFCQNIHSNYTCSCRDGFRLAPDRHDCLDRDECKINNGGCQHVCLNTLGSYECRCLQGYSLAADGKQCHAGPSSCYDVHGCQHYCKKTPAGIRCGCRDGYKLHSDGKRCLQTCQNGNGGCQHKCSESPHGPVCSCHPKYILRPDDKSCIASCRVNNGGCDKKCDDTPQGPLCSCPPGFILNKDSKTCSDVDECATNNGQCSHQCINAHGSYECVCPAGYRLHSDQMTCVDIDECEDNTTCHSGCVNTPGSYTCVCLPGYEKYGETHCADVNECAVHNGGCAQTCDNIDGSFRCSCSTGFRLHQNGKDCVETSRCAPVKSKSNILIESCQRNVSTSTEICVARCTHSHLSTPVPVTTTVTADRHRDRFLMTCGPHTAFTWINNVTNSTVVTCSAALTAPGLSRRAEVVFHTVDCGGPDRQARDMLHRSLLHAVTTFNRKNINCGGECVIQNVDVQCDNDTRRSPRPSRSKTQAILTANFHIQVKPVTPTASCDLDCSRKLTKKRLKRTIHILRQSITDDDLYTNVVPGQKFVVNNRSFKAHKAEELCGVGHMLTTDTCVPCSAGSFFEVAEGTCKSCPPGTYQPLEGQVTCLICPNMAATHGVGIEGASDVTDCKLGCEAGTYSESGFQPCEPCALGTYQPEQGRTYCLSCGKGIPTRRRQATGFHDCVVKERCRPGSYYDKVKGECVLCAKNTYQPQSGQDVCFRCPGNTETDGEGATNSSFCKDRQCGGHIGQYQGYIQTPNWPGYYPNNAECTWSLSAEKGRRILIIVPEIHLAAEDKCGDMLVLRKSASPYSVTTFETCESSETPIAVTSRTRALWVRFKTDGSHTARGFSIPYVSYSEEYQELIEDIVRDGRLYSSHKHQQVLKDRKLLSSLLEVIAEPYKYFQYANSSSTMFPDSFIRLLRNKVLRFFT